MAAAAVPHDDRLSTVHQALRAGASVAELAAATGIDPWFIDQVASVEEHARQIARGWPPAAGTLRAAKRAGLSDAQIAEIAGAGEDEVRRHRHELGIRPVFHTVDSRPSCGMAAAATSAARPPAGPRQCSGAPGLSSERSAFCSASGKLRPIAIASPTDFMWVDSAGFAPGNFSNANRGTLTTT